MSLFTILYNCVTNFFDTGNPNPKSNSASIPDINTETDTEIDTNTDNAAMFANYITPFLDTGQKKGSNQERRRGPTREQGTYLLGDAQQGEGQKPRQERDKASKVPQRSQQERRGGTSQQCVKARNVPENLQQEQHQESRQERERAKKVSESLQQERRRDLSHERERPRNLPQSWQQERCQEAHQERGRARKVGEALQKEQCRRPSRGPSTGRRVGGSYHEQHRESRQERERAKKVSESLQQERRRGLSREREEGRASKVPSMEVMEVTRVLPAKPIPFHDTAEYTPKNGNRESRFRFRFLSRDEQSSSPFQPWQIASPENTPRRERTRARSPSTPRNRHSSPLRIPTRRMSSPGYTQRYRTQPRSRNPSLSPQTRMSSPELAGSEYLEPILAESTYVRQSMLMQAPAPTPVQRHMVQWSYDQYRGAQRVAGVVGDYIGEKLAEYNKPDERPYDGYSSDDMVTSGEYKRPMTTKERMKREEIQREKREKEERERLQTENDNRMIDSVIFEQSITRLHVPRFSSSFPS